MWSDIHLDHDVDISFAATGKEFDNLCNAYKILHCINEASSESNYGGYVPTDDIRGIISCVMFNKPVSVIRYTHRPKMPVLVKCITEAQEQTIEKIIGRMKAKGVLKMSKSGEMAKPMFSADDWLERQKEAR